MVAVAIISQTACMKGTIVMKYFLGTWLKAMKRTAAIGARARPGAKRSRPHRVALRLEALEDRTVPSTLTVTSAADDGSAATLRAEIAAAVSGDTINFDPSLADQTITLTSGELAITKSLDIEGPGADQLTVSGNHAGRVFDISGGLTVTIAGMTITDGLANGSSPVLAGTGGGILNFGTLTLSSDVLSNNQAVGDPSTSPLGRPGTALGGGLANLGTGTLTISSSTFTSNQALGADGSSGTSAGCAVGGALYNRATASITDCQFTFNVAQAGSNCTGTVDAIGFGGAIDNVGSLAVTGSTFSHNQAIGGNNSSGAIRPGLGVGGAILSGGQPGLAATLVVSASTFDHNHAIGGNGNQSPNAAPSLLGPNDAWGGAIHLAGGTASISGCTLEYNSAIAGAGGAGQNGGLALGGGISAFDFLKHGLSVTVSNSTIDQNAVTGGAGGPGGNGGDAWGGGLAVLLGASLTIENSIVAENFAVGGDGGCGGNGGNGLGGGIYNDATDSGGTDGNGIGGGLYLTPGGVAKADLLTVIFANHASTSDDDVFGILSFI
jgi:hypothetical protein